MAVFAFLRQPKWIIFTLLVPVGMALCLLAADWQYSRHVNRSAEDARIRTNSTAAPAPLADVVTIGSEFPEADEYRPVTVTGVFEPDSGVLVRRRPFDGAAGFWVVDNLRTDAGQVVAVLRGWTPVAAAALTTPEVPEPPGGEVTVVGYLQSSENLPDPAPVDLPAGQVAALDTAALLAGTGTPAYSPYLVATAMEPPDPAGLRTLPAPNLGLGPHLAYSWQWIFFALLLPVGWVILARREIQAAREEASRTPAADNVADPVPQRP